MGSVGPAAKAVGMGRAAAYRLRERPGAESFAAAWDRAISMGRMRQYDYAMDRALNGVTIVRVLRGGAVDVSGGPDMAVVHAALRDETVPPSRLKGTKSTDEGRTEVSFCAIKAAKTEERWVGKGGGSK